MEIVKKPPISGFPWHPKTLGEQFLKRRLELGLTQKQVAQKLHLGLQTICRWECGENNPNVIHYPTIIEFLGYYPFDSDETLEGKIIQFRYKNGLSQKKSPSNSRLQGKRHTEFFCSNKKAFEEKLKTKFYRILYPDRKTNRNN